MGTGEEQGATGRRFVVSVVLVALGIGLAVYGLLGEQWPAFGAGIVVVLIFGLTAAGMQRGTASAGPLKVETEFTAPPPPPASSEPVSDEGPDGPRQAP